MTTVTVEAKVTCLLLNCEFLDVSLSHYLGEWNENIFTIRIPATEENISKFKLGSTITVALG